MTTDLSYLKDAPNNSLAARLARRKDAAPAQPQPKVEPISPEIMAEMIQKRRELRLAREKAEADRAMRIYTPNAALSKSLETVAANYQPIPTTLPRSEAPRMNNTRPQRDYTPRDYNASQRSSYVERRKDRPQAPVQHAVPKKLIKEVQEEIATVESQEADEQREVTLSTDVPTLEDGSQPINTTKDSKLVDVRRNRRDRIATTQAKRTEKRLRDGLIEESQIPKALKSEFNNKPKFVLKESVLANIEQRRQARLDREQAGEGRESSYAQRRVRKGPNTRLSRQEEKEYDDDGSATAATPASEDPAYLTTPEPVSATLTDIFKSTPAFRSAEFKRAGLRRAGLKKESYSLYVPDSTSALFSVPAGELSAFDIANLTLSHRADIAIPRRKIALDLVAAATRPRPAGVQANA